MPTIQNTNELLGYLVDRAETQRLKNWFDRLQQRVTMIPLAHEIAKLHADKMTPAEVVQYADELSQELFRCITKREPT